MLLISGQTGVSTNSVLSHVNIRVISTADCQVPFGHWVQGSNICTSGLGGVGICHGDSGGPLLVNRWGQNILVSNMVNNEFVSLILLCKIL